MSETAFYAIAIAVMLLISPGCLSSARPLAETRPASPAPAAEAAPGGAPAPPVKEAEAAPDEQAEAGPTSQAIESLAVPARRELVASSEAAPQPAAPAGGGADAAGGPEPEDMIECPAGTKGCSGGAGPAPAPRCEGGCGDGTCQDGPCQGMACACQESPMDCPEDCGGTAGRGAPGGT